MNRTFYGKVAIVGPSGSGKSYLSKTMNRKTTGYINVERKPLPYKDNKTELMGQPKTWGGFIKNLKDFGEDTKIKQIIVDSQTMAFNMLNKEASLNFSGYDIYKHYNKQVHEYLELLKNIEKDIIVLSHEELITIEGFKQKRMATHGREFEGKIEQHYSIVLYTGTRIKDGKPEYFLKTFEPDTSSKTPEEMFPDGKGGNLIEIPNDAQYIFSALNDYYSE